MLGLRPARYCLREGGVLDVENNRGSARLVHNIGTLLYRRYYTFCTCMYLDVQYTSFAVLLRLFFLLLIYLPLTCLLKIDRYEIKGQVIAA